jgi:hypothetical protein
MADIAGIPYVEARFDEKGQSQNGGEVTVAAGTTDLFVISHGWNNSADEARELYRELFTNFAAVHPPGTGNRTFAVIGVIWPSKKFDELVAASGTPGDGQGAAGLEAHTAASHAVVDQKLSALKELFSTPEQQNTIDELRALVPDLDDKASARRAFADKMRSLLDPSAAGREDASDTFFKSDGNELMTALKIAEDDLGEDVAEANGSASLPLSIGSVNAPIGGAASLGSTLSGFAASALNLLNYTTYYTMKARAGLVGKNGVAPLIDRLAPQVERIHLIGHSFGGRVVAATAASSTTDKVRSLTLLQAAFSHNGFSQSMKGFFRSVFDQQRVKGPILITHTKNDRAVGVAYPLASRINGDTAAAFGDENDKFGGMGRNGAQQMLASERVVGPLLAAGAAGYQFKAGACFNLLADPFIKSHGDVRGREVAYAIACAIG